MRASRTANPRSFHIPFFAGIFASILLCPLCGAAFGMTIPIVSPNAQDGGLFGGTVIAIPDITGDGFVDLAVSASGETVGGVEGAGRVYLLTCRGNLIRALSSPDPATGSMFGFSLAAASDLNGDGTADLIVGAAGESIGALEGAGRVHVFSGADGSLIRTLVSPNPEGGPRSNFTSGQIPNFNEPIAGSFGTAVAAISDLNDDGLDEILVGAPFEDSTDLNGGRAYLFNGTGALMHVFESPNKEENGDFGTRVAAIPDTNGDGYADFAIAAWRETVGTKNNAGRVYIFSGADFSLLHTIVSPVSTAGTDFIISIGNFGSALAGIPDVTGDGRGDLVVGAWLDNNGTIFGAKTGRAYLFSGANGSHVRTVLSPDPEQNPLTGNFGVSVAGVPNRLGNGTSDILVGAWGEDAPTTNTGRAHLFSASGSTLVRETFVSPNPTPTQTILGLAVYGNFGSSVAGLPDVDGDGIGEVVIGAPADRVGGKTSGAVYVFVSGILTGSRNWQLY